MLKQEIKIDKFVPISLRNVCVCVCAVAFSSCILISNVSLLELGHHLSLNIIRADTAFTIILAVFSVQGWLIDWFLWNTIFKFSPSVNDYIVVFFFFKYNERLKVLNSVLLQMYIYKRRHLCVPSRFSWFHFPLQEKLILIVQLYL